MTCAVCGTTLPPGSRFCFSCGAPQGSDRCPTCGAPIVPGASFCSSCGSAIPGAAPSTGPVGEAAAADPAADGAETVVGASERRLTSVLFADLVGYTTLSEERDSDDVRELLSQYFEACSAIVRRYGGIVEKFIGDAVMAVWGVPTAHEDDAERAVRAALEMVAEVDALGRRVGIDDLALRGGVVTGEVSTTVGATDQGMVAGDAVNTAARVQSAAAAREVWVDATTRGLTAAVVAYSDVGRHELKGKAEPLQLFRADRVVAPVGGTERIDGLATAMFARDRELRLLKELFHVTEESGRPRLVVLDGEPGVGKSRLAHEFEKYILDLGRRVAWHRGRCLSYGEGVAYWALSEAIRSGLGLLDQTTDARTLDVLDQALEEYVRNADERAWLQPRLASLLGEGHDEFQREDLFSAWTRYFERVSRGTDPVVLVIDDAHHADSGLLDFIEHLVATARAGIFVLVIARPELTATRPDLGGRRATVIPLGPLSDEAMTELVDDLVEGLPRSALEDLVARAEGVPLYAVETVRALIDRDLVQAVDGHYVVTPGKELDLSSVEAPPSLHALVAARLDALTADERRVVTDASVLGLTFTREGIGVLCPQIDDLDAVLASLQRKEIFSTETGRYSSERGRFRFVQAVVRQVAYSTLSRRDRKSRHLAVAGHLGNQVERIDELGVVVAQHLIDAVESSTPGESDVAELDRRAADLLGKAGARACSLGSLSDGLRLFLSALERLDDSQQRAELQEQATEAALSLVQLDVALDLSRAALQTRDSTGDPEAAAYAASLYGGTLWRRGELRAAADFLQSRYDALLEAGGSEWAQLKLVGRLGNALGSLDIADPAIPAILHTWLRLAEQLEDMGELARAINELAIFERCVGSARVSGALLRDLVDLSRQHRLWSSLAGAYTNLADARLPYSPEDAIEQAMAGVEVAEDHGLQSLRKPATANLALALWAAGEWDRLDDTIQDYLEASDNDKDVSDLIVYAVDLWRRAAGREPIATQMPVVESEEDSVRLWTLHVRMLRAAQAGDADRAAAFAEETAKVFAPLVGPVDDFNHLWPETVRVALAADRVPLAADLLGRVEAVPPGDVTPAMRAFLTVLRAEVAIASQGDPAAIEADLRAGVAAFESYGSPPNRARAEADLGRWLLHQGRTDEAEHLFDAATVAYAALGAPRWAAELAPVTADDRAPT